MRKHIVRFVAVVSVFAVSAFGQNRVVFNNQSGDPALVKLIGPTRTEVEVPNGAKAGTDAAAGRYVIKVRYGPPGNYRYTKGDEFTVAETVAARSETTITLHKVAAGNYESHSIPESEFSGETAIGHPSKTTDPSVFAKSVETIIKEGYQRYSSWDDNDHVWSKESDVLAVTKLLEEETDARWTAILLDRNIMMTNLDFCSEVVVFMKLGWMAPKSPVKDFTMPAPNGADLKTWLNAKGVSMADVRRLYGKPGRIVSETTEGGVRYEVNFYGLVGFRAKNGSDLIEGINMPIIFFQLGHRPFAELVKREIEMRGK